MYLSFTVQTLCQFQVIIEATVPIFVIKIKNGGKQVTKPFTSKVWKQGMSFQLLAI